MRWLALALLLGSAAPALVGPSLRHAPRPRALLHCIRAAADGGAGPTSPTTRTQPPRATASSNPSSFFYHLLVEPFLTPMLRAFEPLDRGDFRWEFLVPWLEEDARMTGPEKAVVAVSFVTLAFALQLQFDPLGSVTDHLSYIAFFFSYAIGNPIAFRIIAMVASVFEIISGAVEQEWAQTSLVPVGYNVLFLLLLKFCSLYLYIQF